MQSKIYRLHCHDARELFTIIKPATIDVTITSPPYFDMKDYGYKEQIGFGQSYESYLADLRNVFESIYTCTKDSGSLWVIIDTFRKDGRMTPLPFDFSNEISTLGWNLQEIIIWEKDKTVPWAHQGQMRSSFEYILLFSKTKHYKFYIDRVRQCIALKKWWIKYPERYNPQGKTPEAIWRFPIPVQGSWGNNYIRHFCPLPEDLIAQIIRLSTDEGDVVLDPFAGSGAVLAKANNMKRRFIGTELNLEYIEMFQQYLRATGRKKRKQYLNETKSPLSQDAFSQLIINLRALKFAKILYSKLGDMEKNCIQRFFVNSPDSSNPPKGKIAEVRYVLLITAEERQERLLQAIKITINKPPLSKFGIAASFDFVSSLDHYINTKDDLYSYTQNVTHKFNKIIRSDIAERKLTKSSFIISPIKVSLNEEDFE